MSSISSYYVWCVEKMISSFYPVQSSSAASSAAASAANSVEPPAAMQALTSAAFIDDINLTIDQKLKKIFDEFFKKLGGIKKINEEQRKMIMFYASNGGSHSITNIRNNNLTVLMCLIEALAYAKKTFNYNKRKNQVNQWNLQILSELKIMREKFEQLEECVNLYIDHCTNINLRVRETEEFPSCESGCVDLYDPETVNALDTAIEWKLESVALKLLSKGADVNLPLNAKGKPPLVHACKKDMQNVANKLIETGADVFANMWVFDANRSTDTTALFYAARNLWPSTIALLHKAAQTAKKNIICEISTAVFDQMPKPLISIIEEYDGRTGLDFYGAQNFYGSTPLHWLVQRKNPDDFTAANLEAETAELLLKYGGDKLCLIKNMKGNTPIDDALYQGKKRIHLLKIMLKAGGDKSKMHFRELIASKSQNEKIDPEVLKLLDEY